MAYKQLEPACETMLKTAFTAVCDTGTTFRCWWLADAGAGVDEPATYPQVNLRTTPNVPTGWHVRERDMLTEAEVVTYAADDPTHSQAWGLYHAIRAAVDSNSFSDTTNFNTAEVWPIDGADAWTDEDEGLHHILIPLNVHVCANTQ